MADIEKLREVLQREEFANLDPEQAHAAGLELVDPPETVIAAQKVSKFESLGLGEVSLADIKEALNPAKKKRSPDGAPGSWHIQSEGKQFRLFWDSKPADAPLFDTEVDAEIWMKEWYADNPPVEVTE